MGLQFGNEDQDDANKDEEVHLERETGISMLM